MIMYILIRSNGISDIDLVLSHTYIVNNTYDFTYSSLPDRSINAFNKMMADIKG